MPIKSDLLSLINEILIKLNSLKSIVLIGKPFRRYSSFTEPQNMEQDIKFLLGEVPQPSTDGSAIEYYNSRMPKELVIKELD